MVFGFDEDDKHQMQKICGSMGHDEYQFDQSSPLQRHMECAVVDTSYPRNK